MAKKVTFQFDERSLEDRDKLIEQGRMVSLQSPFTEGKLPSLSHVEHWHEMYLAEKQNRELLERENNALRDLLEIRNGDRNSGS